LSLAATEAAGDWHIDDGMLVDTVRAAATRFFASISVAVEPVYCPGAPAEATPRLIILDYAETSQGSPG
jgi:hypothetical protein